MAAHSGDENTYLYVRGEPVLSMAEFDDYVYALPEDAVPPETVTRWAFGQAVEPGELLTCLRNEATNAAGKSDQALEIVRAALERLERYFPDEAQPGFGR